MMGLVSLIGCPINSFTAHNYTRSNIVESHTQLEPDTCAATEGISEIKMVVYSEIVKMKQDRIIPVFHCQVVEETHSTLVTGPQQALKDASATGSLNP
jgi:hypothetical protein